MAKFNRRQIQDNALEILEATPGGIRWNEMLKLIHAFAPETPQNSIHGALQVLLSGSDEIVKVARGTYQLRKYQDDQSSAAIAQDDAVANEPLVLETASHVTISLLESDFYESFAVWLADVAEEVNVAVSLGGSVLRGKWGTPDVIGVLKPRAQDILKFEPQIVSAEIKIDPNQPVVAFGQAVAYRLFSHKSYIVVPKTTSEDDLSRLKALCTIHGVGLVTFMLDKAAPDYTVIVLPAQASPDMFYANQMLRRLLDSSPAVFNKLF
ncbi:hypothetical protein EWE75_11255 [Sphingomonas populi]|uniref:HTH HARE-type domain-containing protein n=1 Tax=Sphingomonas populi TaxID=2484750 RepID=A0A4Q6Y4I9_9SPHN|nr:hypothetical protein [Sphingomonas populi]RZF64329.1 hypothetical protein EWE75_11255 [Sphingomonas populi]